MNYANDEHTMAWPVPTHVVDVRPGDFVALQQAEGRPRRAVLVWVRVHDDWSLDLSYANNMQPVDEHGRLPYGQQDDDHGLRLVGDDE